MTEHRIGAPLVISIAIGGRHDARRQRHERPRRTTNMGHMSDDITNAPIPVVRTASGKPMAATEIKATATTIEDVRQAGRRDGLREAAEYLDGIKCAHAAAMLRHRAESPAPRGSEPPPR